MQRTDEPRAWVTAPRSIGRAARALLPGILAIGLTLAAAADSSGQTLKLGSLAPPGSPWDLAMRRMAAEWARMSAGDIELNVYPGGIVGDEPDILRKMRIGQLDAAALSATGLATVYSGVLALGMPFLFRDQDELAYVMDRMQPFIEKQLERQGLKVLMWTAAGWVYFFSRDPSPSPNELRRQKLWIPEAKPADVRAWQDAGFRVVELPATEITLGLQAGLIDAFLTSPLIAASYQWFGIADDMTSIAIAPFYGATVISTRTWRRLPAELRPRLVEAAGRAAREASLDAIDADREAIAIMQRFGLTVHEPTGSDAAEWRILQDAFLTLVGVTIDERAFLLVEELIGAYRTLPSVAAR